MRLDCRAFVSRCAKRAKIIFAAFIVVTGAASIPVAEALAEPSIWDKIYSPAQAQRGQALYKKACASCHRDSLEGHGTTPSLAGSAFLGRWDGQTVDDLFEKMQVTMPADKPGSMSREENGEILAFILQFNELPAGETDLRTESESLAKILFKAEKPK